MGQSSKPSDDRGKLSYRQFPGLAKVEQKVISWIQPDWSFCRIGRDPGIGDGDYVEACRDSTRNQCSRCHIPEYERCCSCGFSSHASGCTSSGRGNYGRSPDVCCQQVWLDQSAMERSTNIVLQVCNVFGRPCFSTMLTFLQVLRDQGRGM